MTRAFSSLSARIKKRLTPLYMPVIRTGTSGLPEEAAKRVMTVNAISLISAVIAFVSGNLFYLYGELWKVQLPALTACLLFCGVILMNKERSYSLACIAVTLVHCASALYFGILLGPQINVSLIVVCLCGSCFLVYPKPSQQFISVSATLLTMLLLELNYYFQVFQPLIMSVETQFLLRWTAVPFFLLFDVLVVVYYAKENKALANRLKTFVYRKISHEIRNQLNAMSLISQLIKREIKLDNNMKKLEPYIDQQLTAQHNMRNILNNVLDIAQIESGSADKADEDTFSIRSLIKKVVNLHKVSARSRNLKLELKVAEGMPDIIVTDALKLTMILTNLLGNAIKYADRNTAITIQVARSAGMFSMAISNQCPDIPAEQQTVLFEMYTTDKRSKYTEGSGLGLYITRNKVDSLGGRIKLHSKNGLTTFTVLLPLQEGRAADIEEEVTEAEIDLSNINVLLADDNNMNNMLFSKYLTMYGCNAICTSSGREALQYLEKTRQLPELIILDHQMPDLDGEQTLLLLKKNPLFKNIPVLICTGAHEHEKALTTAGAAAILLKPIDPHLLFKEIRTYLPHIDEVSSGLFD
ncbi:hybrid sensor histidine kinase/response regulator [uncultured Chitinophaga sp.]|jgi:Signal transduction histidine kinase|uniref:ATP-binding response regulator n=1 Tax=uncultured Chitinophaga sp. TaxID=339340 RepID=UPI002614CA57|nr:hybrid sensor histidine kinase/response regulator [uncultured Chitinophaga sp.]